jgi:putative ABC transport system permease protein
MNRIALRMLMGDRAKYIGIIFGITFASLLITQQMSVFTGIMYRTFATITDIAQPQLWVMDPKVAYIDDIKPLQSTQLFRVRSVEGVEWAVPFYKGLLRARLANGTFQSVSVLGIDDATLLGGPAVMVEGRLEDLRRTDGVIVDEVAARTRLAKPSSAPNMPPEPLRIGDTLEINDRRATVVGLCRTTRSFQSQPVIYTTFTRATSFAPRERKLLSFVLVGVAPGHDEAAVAERIEQRTGLQAVRREDFMWKTVMYFIKFTGIPINIGTAVLLGFIVGTAIAGMTFFNFTQDNLKQFGALKAMGASNWVLLRMTILQSMTVGTIGYGLGVGAASLFGYLARNSELAFRMPWQVLLISAGAVLVICVLSAVFSIIKVMRLEPAIVFKA